MKRRKNKLLSQHPSVERKEKPLCILHGAVQAGHNVISFVTALNLPSSLIAELRNIFAFDNVSVWLSHNFLLCAAFLLRCFWGWVVELCPCQCCLHCPC